MSQKRFQQIPVIEKFISLSNSFAAITFHSNFYEPEQLDFCICQCMILIL